MVLDDPAGTTFRYECSYEAALAVMASPFLSNQMTLSETAKICRMANKCKFIMNIHF